MMELYQLLESIPSKNPDAQVFDESSADDFEMELARATPEEKENCLIRVTDRQTLTPKETAEALKQLQEVARLEEMSLKN